MQRLLILLILISTQAITIWGQDFHLSNYQPAMMQFNPAQTAASGHDVQLGVQYRKQWAAIPDAYRTLGAIAELRGRNTGFGVQVIQMDAGEASLKTTGVMLSGAYHKPLARESELSLGIAVGRLQKSFNPAAFTYDNQFVEGQGFNPNLESGEFFARTSAAITDVSIGLNWKGLFSENGKVRGRGGFALAHVHRPDEGFQGFVEELPLKAVAHFALDIRVDGKFDLSPNIFYQKQGVHREIVVGGLIDGQVNRNTSVIFGIGYRVKDAIIGQLGLRHRNKHIYLSYDANISELKTATGGNGAIELGLYLTFDRKYKKQLVDTDEDGIYDHRDRCPKVPGPAKWDGCPDEKVRPVEEEPVRKKRGKKHVEPEWPLEDADRDGVIDQLDQCPLEPGLPCFYGCNDKDRDGLIDPDDSCPEIFGPPENQGCPVQGRDSDRDGIPDDLDYCVYLKGVREFHGCPDSDQDDISDVDDSCPYQKGTHANDGCPNEVNLQQNTRQSDPSSVVVEFDTNESFIKPEFAARLSEFAKGVPQAQGARYRIVVSGHTDTEGAAYYNYALSERRANSVMDYLVRQGIPYHRFETIAYGEAIPRQSNTSEHGKSRNRRCEVSLILE